MKNKTSYKLLPFTFLLLTGPARTFVIFLFSFVLTSCSESTSPPGNKTCPVPDTTSHLFNWTVDTLGDYGSTLKDVAIISENNVWAVGDIRYQDETYSACIWDNQKWTYRKLMYDNSVVNMESILAFTDTDIWFAAGSIVHWNGSELNLIYQRNISSGEFITNLWGSSGSNLVGIGNDGAIVRYDGNSWKRHPNITDRDLNDVKGIVDPETGQTRIWIGGKTTMLYSPDGENWQVVWDLDNPLFPDNYINVNALYIPDKCHIIASIWNGQNCRLFKMRQDNLADYEILGEHRYFSYAMTGNHYNDIIVAASYNSIYHFNGIDIEQSAYTQGGAYNFGVDYKNSITFIVGSTIGFQGIVFQGIR